MQQQGMIGGMSAAIIFMGDFTCFLPYSQQPVDQGGFPNPALSDKRHCLTPKNLMQAIKILPIGSTDRHCLIPQFAVEGKTLMFLLCEKDVALVQDDHDRGFPGAGYYPVDESWPERRTFHTAYTNHQIHVGHHGLVASFLGIPALETVASLKPFRDQSLSLIGNGK
jgi:hypothetical protein